MFVGSSAVPKMVGKHDLRDSLLLVAENRPKNKESYIKPYKQKEHNKNLPTTYVRHFSLLHVGLT